MPQTGGHCYIVMSPRQPNFLWCNDRDTQIFWEWLNLLCILASQYLQHLHSAPGPITHRNDEVGQRWEFHCKSVDPGFQVCCRLSSESCSLFQKQNKTNNSKLSAVLLMLFSVDVKKKCIRMWLSLADERGVAILEPMSSKMHWICN